MSIRNRLLVSLGAVLTVAAVGASEHATSAAPEPVAHDRDSRASCEARFDRAVRAYTDTTHQRDVEGWGSLLHPDVTVVFAGGDVLYGKQQTMEWARGFFVDPAWTQTFEERTRVVEGCRSGFVLFDSEYTPEPGADPKPLVIGITFTFDRGRWLVLHNQDSNGPSVGTPPRAG